jgi:dihydrofolate reductase
MRPKVALIAAVAPGRIIGSENRMPWHMPRDLRFFRRVTSGFPVIMGRKTFESLKRRALPNRRNIVVSRNLNYNAPGCEVVHSLEEAIQLCSNVTRVFVIGGGQLYAAALPLADEIYLTQIENQNPTSELFELFKGDTFFPKINETEWKLAHEGRRYIASNKMRHPTPEKHSGLYFQFLKFTRVR